MPTDTSTNRPRAADFLLRAAAWGLGIFGLLRLDWVERHALLPLTQLQGCAAIGLCGAPVRPITATLACSGADVLAICLGAILAYPARWRSRLTGAAGGLALILALNTLRIGTLGRLAGSPSLFQAFHVFVWPAVLSLAVAGYVFAWMRLTDRRREITTPSRPEPAADAGPGERPGFRPTRRFVLLAAALLLAFTAAAPLYLQSTVVLSVAASITSAAAAVLRLLGVDARASANLLWTPRGSFLVTQECISTPLIPIYLAAAITGCRSWRSRFPALLAAAPLFFGLGVARLLVVALPASVAGSPTYLVHAFFQIVLAAVVVVLAALWHHPDRGAAVRRALVGLGLGASFVLFPGSPYTRLVLLAARALGGAPPTEDPQGAIALLPSFQTGFYLALWVAARTANGWRSFFAGSALLGLLQLLTLATIPLLADHVSPPILVQAVRAWTLAAPLLVVACLRFFAVPGQAALPRMAPK